MHAEWLKARRSAPLRLALVFPVPLSLLGLAIGSLTPNGVMATYAWSYWAFLLCPVLIVLQCTSVAGLDRDQNLQTVLTLPLSPSRVWWAKTAECSILLLLSNLAVWLITTAGCFCLRITGPSVLHGLSAALAVTAMLIWMIPIGLWLSTWLGALPGVGVPLLVQVVCSLLFNSSPLWWVFPPCGVLHVIAPMVGVMPDGSPIEDGNMFGEFGSTDWMALLLGLGFATGLAALTAAWFNARETG